MLRSPIPRPMASGSRSETSRRGFFRLLGGALALLCGRPSAGAETEGALEVHHATRNTRLGALGVRMPRIRRRPSPFKLYPDRDRVALPAARAEPTPPLTQVVAGVTPSLGFGPEGLSLRQLAGLLYFTNGVTGKRSRPGFVLHLRAAPSAGALYAGEVYVVAERVRGLAPGIYYYAVVDHELIALRRGSFLHRVADGVARPAAVEGAGAAILLTNVFHRYSWRYANRGYRYALIDTGHVGENLRLTAASSGLRWSSEPRFEDAILDKLLEVDGREEAVCAVHAVGTPGERSHRVSPPPRVLAEAGLIAPDRVPRAGSPPERFHAATKLIPGPPAVPGERPPVVEPGAAGVATALPVVSRGPDMSAESAIRGRRSAAFFGDGAVALEQLAFALDMARAAQRSGQSSHLELYVVAHRVEGLAPGLYRHRARERHLVAVRRGDLRRAMTAACLGQEKAGAAGVGFVMVGRITEAARHRGERSYRDLLIESGEIGQRIYLAAEALGLVARNLSAFIDDDFNHLLGFDGRQRAVLHLTMFGEGG